MTFVRSILGTAAAIAMLCGASTAFAQNAQQTQGASPVTEEHSFGSWAVRCYRTAGAACDMSQSVVLQQRNVRELGVSLVFIPNRNAYAGEFIVPLGVAFAKGMTIVVGSYTLPNLRYNHCERGGCFVEGVLPQPLIDAMQSSGAQRGEVRIEAVNGRKYAFPFLLNGFGDGLALLRQLDMRTISVPAKP